MENAIKIQVPVSVSYAALEDVLKKQFVGEYIPKPEAGLEESPYAQILDVGIAKSSTGANDIILNVKIRVLRTILKRDNVDLFVLATPEYDNSTEQFFVQKFKLEARTSSGFYNTALEVLVNKVAYTQILKKTRFNVQEIISKEQGKANGLLESGFELKGLRLLGKVEEVRVQDVNLQKGRVSIMLELQANMEAEIFDLLSLMPAE